MKKLASLAIAATLAISLSACSDSGEIEKGGAEKPAAKSSPTVEPAAEDNKELQFGDKYTYENGVSLSISKPVEFKPSEAGLMIVTDPKGKKFVAFDVTIANGSEEDYDPTLATFTASSGGEEAEAVFDTENKLSGSPSTTVKIGKTVKFKVGFAVTDEKDITMDAAPGFEYGTKTFEN